MTRVLRASCVGRCGGCPSMPSSRRTRHGSVKEPRPLLPEDGALDCLRMRRVAPANATTVVENFAVLGRRGDWAGRLSAVQQSERMDPMGKAKDIKHAAEGAPLRPARRPEGHHRGGRGGAACRRRDERARSPGGEAVGRRLSRRRNADYCREQRASNSMWPYRPASRLPHEKATSSSTR
jgi:hypothetical protein